MDASPYFETIKVENVTEISQLFELTKAKEYGSPGKSFRGNRNKEGIYTVYDHPYRTTGLFRGQVKDFPLIPSAYRNTTLIDCKESDNIISLKYNVLNSKLNEFSRISAYQNMEFPRSKIEQMIIAQHYGIETPLLDWTTNIFTAIYFILEFNKVNIDEYDPHIYHLCDERLLEKEVDEKNIEKQKKSCIVKPLPIDRRIERQFSIFTFHPLPFSDIEKIPIIDYKISKDKMYFELLEYMKGLGFNSFHYFPDYAGIVEKLNTKNLL